jgi:PAS domain S-box-containing protein/putative nucleotidyltransferase with HDIG domain
MGKPLRVLMIEDSEDDVLLTSHALKKGGFDPVYERVETAGAMRTALQEKTWDIILCDYQMPQFNGLAAIALLKETGSDIPLIIVSGAIGEETAVECMRSGAHDYVIKDNLSRLVPAIERELQEAESRSKRRQAEEALRESEEKFKTIFDRASDGILIANPVTKKFLQGNTAMCSMLGYTNEEIENLTVHDIHPPDDISRVLDEFEKLLKGEKIIAEGLPVLRKDGTIFYADISGATITLEKISNSVGIFRDITERKRAEETLQESEQRFMDVLRSSNDAILLIDGEKFVDCNEATARMLGYPTRDEFLKTHPSELSPPTQPDGRSSFEKAEEMMGTALQRGFNQFEWEHRKANGEDFPVEVSLTSIVLHGKNVLYCMWRDITERKRVEEDLRRTLDSLRKAVGTTIQVMVSAIEVRDPYTAGHQIRVTNLARAIAIKMELPRERIEAIRMAGPIHDIGKLSVPAEILSKPTKLTNIEFALIKEHVRTGYEMLKDVESPWPLAEIVYQHHERMDGSGYPRNLKGNEILMEARIMAVADVVESMASHRPYRPALGIEAALNEIEKNRGIFYDETVANACLILFREKGFKLEGA